MRLHGTLTKYTCLSSTLYTSLLMLRGEEVPCNLTQICSNTPRSIIAFGETITTFYEYAHMDSRKPNTPGSSNTFYNSIPCVSNHSFIMGNQLTKKEKGQVIDLLIKYENGSHSQ